MESLQQILDRFLEFFQGLPDMIGGLWETINQSAPAIGVVISLLALLVAIPRIKLVADELATQVDEDRRTAGQARPVLLAAQNLSDLHRAVGENRRACNTG